MRQEPELAHPFNRRTSNDVSVSVTSSSSSKVSSAEKAHAKSLRNAGKEAFLTVVRETVEELAVEAAAQALQDEEARTDGMHKRDRSSGGGSSRSHRRSSSRHSDHDLVPGPAIRPGVGPSQDSVSGSPFRPSSSSRSGGGGGHSRRSSNSHRGGDDDEPSERRRRRHRNGSMGQGEGHSIVAAAMATFGGGIGSANGGSGGGGGGGGGGGDKPRSFKGAHGHQRATSQASSAAADRAIALEEEEQAKACGGAKDTMEDDERETLLELLSGAYGQVNDLTDELKMSLDKLSDTEQELKALARSQSNPQLLPKPSPTSDLQSPKDVDMEDADAAQKRKPVSKILKGMFPSDEGAKSTPAAVRQLQVEVQRLRQRNAQAHAKEEKHKSDMSHMQRLMAVMESQINKADQDNNKSTAAPNGSSSRSAKQPPEGTYCMTPGGTRYQDGVTKPLVARVAELEEKLVQCSMENATAKQEHLTAQLNGQKLEKTLQKLRHELAKSRAMNDLLQNEIDRLQGHDPEGEADGSGWRRWLGGVQEPLSPDPNPIQVSGDSDSPVVVVRDLDNNQLVYAPGRSQFT